MSTQHKVETGASLYADCVRTDETTMMPLVVRPAYAYELRDVLQLRKSAYGRHEYLSDLAESLSTMDSYDEECLSTTYVAVRGDTILGTLRCTLSDNCFAYYPPDMCKEFPDCLLASHVHLDRFAVVAGAGEIAALLVKASVLHGEAAECAYGVAVVKPSAARLYARLGGMSKVFGNRVFQYGGAVRSVVVLVASKGREDMQRINPLYYEHYFNVSDARIVVDIEPTQWMI